MGVIKVYDGIIGKRLREAANIAGTTQAEVLGSVVALWMWAIDNADEDGVVKHSSRKDVMRCVSGVSDDLFTEITDALFKQEYVLEQDGCLLFPDWKENQLWSYKEKIAKKRDMERKRAERMKCKDSAKPAHKSESVNLITIPNSEQAEEKVKEAKKRNKPKKHYAEFVLMTEEEYFKLCDTYGEPLARAGVEILNQYIGSTGRKYKSHYMTIIGWPVEKAMKQNPTLFAQHKAAKSGNNNPYDEYMRDDQ